MNSLEAVLYWVSVGVLAAATIVVFAGLIWRRQEWLDRGWLIAAAGVAVQAATIGVRWYTSGHFPYIEVYENVLVGAFAMVASYVVLTWRRRELRLIGAVILPAVLISLGYGYANITAPGPVTPPYQSLWLVVHVTFAWITYAAYSVVAGLAVALLVRQRAERRGVEARGVPSWVPPTERIDDISLRVVAFGFLNNAIMIASGSIWAFRLWGSYWSWDPVETWSLLTWLAYGFYLHAHITLKWRGTRLAVLALFALFGVMMTFWGVQLVPNAVSLWGIELIPKTSHLFLDMSGTSSRP